MEARAVIQGSLDNLYAEIQDRNAVIHFNDQHLPKLIGQKGQLMQLFQNIIANSLKYSAPQTVPIIDISHIEEADFQVFSIKDNGIGIAPEDQEKIFQPFIRLHDSSTYEGFGLGLSYCQQIMQKMGGKITLTSTPGRGTTVFLKFAKTKESELDRSAAKKEKHPLGKRFSAQVRAASF